MWFILGIILAGLELAAGELTFLMLAIGALATAGIALADIPLWAEILVFAFSSLAALYLLKPALKKKLRLPTAISPASQEIVGYQGQLESAELIDINGDLWSVQPFDAGSKLRAGDSVTVVACDGTYVFVTKEG